MEISVCLNETAAKRDCGFYSKHWNKAWNWVPCKLLHGVWQHQKCGVKYCQSETGGPAAGTNCSFVMLYRPGSTQRLYRGCCYVGCWNEFLPRFENGADRNKLLERVVGCVTIVSSCRIVREAKNGVCASVSSLRVLMGFWSGWI